MLKDCQTVWSKVVCDVLRTEDCINGATDIQMCIKLLGVLNPSLIITGNVSESKDLPTIRTTPGHIQLLTRGHHTQHTAS